MNQNGQRSSFDSKQSNDFDQYKMSYSEAMEILGLKPGAKKNPKLTNLITGLCNLYILTKGVHLTWHKK